MAVTGCLGCDFFEPSTNGRKCVVNEVCGSDVSASNAISTCAAALEDPGAFRDELVTACRQIAEDCDAGVGSRELCAAPEGGRGGSGGVAGTGSGGGPAGTSAAGESGTGDGGSGTGGQAGSGAGSGAAGADAGGGGTSACTDCNDGQLCDEESGLCVQCLGNADCDGSARVCTDDHRCVGCTKDEHCPAATPACDTDTNTCVRCKDSAVHCGGSTPLCDQGRLECVQCLKNADCTDPGASSCASGTCMPCIGPLHCDHITGRGVCDTSSGTGKCVECTGARYEACGTDPVTTQPFVCDSVNRTCTDQTKGSSGLCGQCVSDAECQAGQLCVLQDFENKTIGYFCMWRRGAGVGGAPSSCTNARPYFNTIVDAESIDGTTADVCTLAVSTCPAHADFRSSEVNCAPGGVPNDSLCGFPGVADGYCRALPPPDTDVYRCTVPCGSVTSEDCRVGFDCDTIANPPYCKL